MWHTYAKLMYGISRIDVKIDTEESQNIVFHAAICMGLLSPRQPSSQCASRRRSLYDPHITITSRFRALMHTLAFANAPKTRYLWQRNTSASSARIQLDPPGPCTTDVHHMDTTGATIDAPTDVASWEACAALCCANPLCGV